MNNKCSILTSCSKFSAFLREFSVSLWIYTLIELAWVSRKIAHVCTFTNSFKTTVFQSLGKSMLSIAMNTDSFNPFMLEIKIVV